MIKNIIAQTAFAVVLRILARIRESNGISQNLQKISSDQIEMSNRDISLLFPPKKINIEYRTERDNN